MKAVIYARYSSDNQREESIEGQIRECTAFAEKNDITILKHYIDRAYSARTDNRPEFQAMIKDSDKRLFDMVIVWKLDRFSRDRYDSTRYKLLLKKNGVKVVSATEQISEGAEGIILESVLEGYAEYYSADLAEKVHRGMTENALKGKCNGGTRPVGYIIDAEQHFQPDPVTAPFVLEAFKRYAEGSTMKEIAAFFKENGIRNTLGGEIKPGSIQRMLNNRRYIGEYSYKDVIVSNAIPAIVPQNLFDRVQNMMVKNKKAPARHKAEDDYLLTTKLFCGTCRSFMVGESGTSAAGGRKYHYYRCVNTKKRKTCDAKHKSIRKEPLETAVVMAVKEMIMDDDFVEYFVDLAMELQGKESSELPALRKQLSDTEKGIENMLNAIQMGIINDSTKRRLDELEAAKQKLELSIIREEIKKPVFSRDQIRFFITQFRSLDVGTLEGRRRLIDGFVNSVVVYDDHILVMINYKDKAKRISFKEIESSDLSSLGGPPFLEKPPF